MDKPEILTNIDEAIKNAGKNDLYLMVFANETKFKVNMSLNEYTNLYEIIIYSTLSFDELKNIFNEIKISLKPTKMGTALWTKINLIDYGK